uniref:Dephospho-CoA kinase n=1 Tax=Panagrolaimus sp. JU765 TaxID=591449 RepID=A0AC34R026_9BILA
MVHREPAKIRQALPQHKAALQRALDDVDACDFTVNVNQVDYLDHVKSLIQQADGILQRISAQV